MIRARIEPDIKAKTENIFRALGLTASDAIGIFYRQVMSKNGLPFDVKIPNKTTLKAIKDAEIKKDLAEAKDFNDLLKISGIKLKKNA